MQSDEEEVMPERDRGTTTIIVIFLATSFAKGPSWPSKKEKEAVLSGMPVPTFTLGTCPWKFRLLYCSYCRRKRVVGFPCNFTLMKGGKYEYWCSTSEVSLYGDGMDHLNSRINSPIEDASWGDRGSNYEG